MPYHIGAKGSNGCSGYPVVSDEGHVAGCHGTEAEATAQLGALYANVPDATKDYSIDVGTIVTSPVKENPSNNINQEVGMRKPNYLTASRKAKKKKTNKAEMADLYVMLSEEEKAFTDALNGIANKFGKLKEDGGIWIGYVPAVVNEDAYMGVMCKNCVFFEGNNGCNIIAQKVEEAGICRLAAIPDDLITAEESDGTYDGCGCMTCMSLNCDCEYCPVCNPNSQADEIKSDCCPDLNKQSPCWDGYVQRGMKPGDNGQMVPNCVPAKKSKSLFANFGKDFSKTTKLTIVFPESEKE
jgi:hypothetical protein